MQDRLRSQDAQLGHVKLFLSTGAGSLTANLTSIDGPVLVRKDGESLGASKADMTFNARVQMDPERLQRMSLETLKENFEGVSVEVHGIRSLRPGRPRPTFRYSKRV